MKIYYTRHGENVWNATNRVCGVSDIPLNENGIQQAHGLAERLLLLKEIDLIISSPLKRAYETAKIVSAKIDKPVTVDNRFIEWNYGKYEGCDRHDTYEVGAPTFQEAKLHFAVRIGKTGESLLQLAQRVYTAIDEIRERHSGKNILIVAHNGVCRVIEAYHRDMTTLEFSQYFLKHCELRCWDLGYKG